MEAKISDDYLDNLETSVKATSRHMEKNGKKERRADWYFTNIIIHI